MNAISKRVINEAEYMIKTKKTIRDVAREFNVSKSTVHIDLNVRLKNLSDGLYENVKNILYEHLKTRHLRGGESTRKKYENLV